MSDPISGGGGIGKASQQIMQEMQRQMQEVQQQGPEKASFKDTVAVNDVQKTTEVQKVQEAQKTTEVQKTQNAADVLRAARAGTVNPTAAVKVVEKSSATARGFSKLIGQLAGDQTKLDKIIKMATSGKAYGQQELLAIQASVYKFSQELELTSKVVEKATSGIKQTMQTQV